MSNFKIYLADDDEDDRFLFEQALFEMHSESELITADNGEHLLTLLAGNNADPHLIILDINMPRKNGLTCLTELRLIDKYHQVPIVIFSTSVEQHYVENAFARGADYYIRKPSSFRVLREIASFCLDLCSNRKTTVKKSFLVNFNR
jgi:CheY-like chemotaxis protein